MTSRNGNVVRTRVGRPVLGFGPTPFAGTDLELVVSRRGDDLVLLSTVNKAHAAIADRRGEVRAMNDKVAFKQINREIEELIDKLEAKGVCPCCVGLSLMYRGAFLYAEAVSTDDTVELCEEIADTLLEGDGMPDGETAH
jgi:hypothetical protein